MENLAKKDFNKLLGLELPWEVGLVEFDGDRIDVTIKYRGSTGKCRNCSEEGKLHDRRKSREFRHLNTMQYETYLHCRIPRVKCKSCKRVISIPVPWSESYNGRTFLFENEVVRVLQISRSVEETRKHFNLTWHQVERIKSTAVARGISRRQPEEIKNIGLDEKSFRKGHRYVTVLNNLDSSRVIDLVEGRSEAAAKELINKGLDKKQKKAVKAVAVDMWKAFSNAVRSELVSADIVHDHFHISKHMNDAVDKTRRIENRKLLKADDRSLVGRKYEFTRNSENIDRSLFKSFKNLQASGYKTARAWAIKEMFRQFWKYSSVAWARKFFNSWYSWAIRSRLEAIKKVARMLKKHLPNILTYFKHKITNAVSEGINSKIQTVKSNSRGFHSFESFRTTVLFYCGKLDMLHFPH